MAIWKFGAKSGFLAGTSILALGLAVSSAYGQTATSAPPDTAPAASPAPSEVVVTGSRIRTGFATPTPVTVETAQQLRASAPLNLADGLNQLPVFNGSTLTTQGGGGNVSAGTNGQNLLSLRGLGPTRTLVLLDGRRMVATNQNGSTDVNTLPQNLVSRVDVVTGGASAAYGSDAVAGVVNFVLDTKFNGVKLDLHGGESTYGDAGSADASIAAGHSWMDGRLRLIGSAEYFHQDGIGINDDAHRPWYELSSGQFPNPVTGALPSILVVPNIRSSIGSNGGLISSGPLKGTQFLPGGVSAPFNYGTITGTTFQSGGDGGNPANGLSPDQERDVAFLHGEFDLNHHATLYGEVQLAHTQSHMDATITPQLGAGGQFTIFRDNAYLPGDVLARMIAANVQSIPLGRYETEFGPVVIKFRTNMDRFVIGSKGDLWGGWRYDLNYTYGHSDQEGGQYNLPNLRNLYAAADAVVNPANGQIVCRSTLSGYDAGCVPMNLFGQGSISKAAASYILGNSFKDLGLTQQVASFNANGDLGDRFRLPAGKISVATGFEYRKEEASQTSDPVSQSIFSATGLRGVPSSLAGRLGVYQFNNPQPLNGSYDVKEVYAEAGIPILKDLPFARAFDVDGAIRYTDYSQSGGVNTWKVGANWQISDELRFRVTRSQDIRGPNTLELYNAQTQTNQTVIYHGVTTQDTVIQSGNPNLKPEVAQTITYGFVYRPQWLAGLQMSVDYYKIAIADAIAQLGHQVIVDNCAAGSAIACSQITVNSNGTLTVRSQGLNLNTQQTEGIDYEAAYRMRLFDGNLNLRALATNLLSDFQQAPGSAPLKTLGSPTSPRWRATFSAEYSQGPWSAYAQERVIGNAYIDPTKIQGIDTSHNDIPAVWYTDLTFRYSFKALGSADEAFLSINNLFNRSPPVSGGNPTTYSVPYNFAYDAIGRYFTVGVRAKF